MGYRVRPVALTGADQQVVTGNALWCGFSVRETSEISRATIVFRAGTDVSGTILETISLAPGQSRGELYAPAAAIEALGGVWADVSGPGTVEGSARVAA